MTFPRQCVAILAFTLLANGAQADCRETEAAWHDRYFKNHWKLSNLEITVKMWEGSFDTATRFATSQSIGEHRKATAFILQQTAPAMTDLDALNDENNETAVALRNCGLTGWQFDKSFEQGVKILNLWGRMRSVRFTVEERLKWRETQPR